MINKFYISTIFLFSFLIAGCGNLTRYDISNDSLYKTHIGDTYKTKKKMTIIGVKLDRSEDIIDYYEIVSLPGVGGPEIVQLGYLSAGITLKIIKIIKESPSLFLGQDIVFVAEILEDYQFEGREVNISSAFGTYTKVAYKNLYVLNPKYFEKIPLPPQIRNQIGLIKNHKRQL